MKNKRLLKFSIAKKAALYILLASSVITTIFTSISFYIDYSNEISDLHKMYRSLNKTYIEPIAKAVWDFDQGLLNSQVKGILNIPEVFSVEIKSELVKMYQERPIDDLSKKYSEIKTFNLKVPRADNAIAFLIIRATKYPIYKRIFHKLVYFFSTQFLKTLMISFIIFTIFQFIITRHLIKFADKVAIIDFEEIREPVVFSISEKKHDYDEIHFLGHSLTQMTDLIARNNIKYASEISTQVKKIEEQEQIIENSAKLKAIGEMASGVAHEINNPLAVISLSTDVLGSFVKNTKLDPADEKKLSDQLHKIKTTVEHISKTVSGLLTLARNSDNLKVENYPVSKILEVSTALCLQKFEKAKVRFQLNVPKEEIFVSCNITSASQILLNLLNNAYDEIKDHKNPEIGLVVDYDNDNVNFIIEDNGKGVPEDLVDKIFDPFFSTKVNGKGAGIGLAISKSLAQKNGGDLTLEDPKNARFSLKLKRYKT